MNISNSIQTINLTDVDQLDSRVEHRTVYNLKNCQLNIFETYQQTKDVELSFDGLVVSSMMRGKKWVSLDELNAFSFVPGESIILPKDQKMKIDFPEATFQTPVQCATIAMNWDEVQRHIDFLNEQYPLGNDGKDWELNFDHYHFDNNQELAYSINKLMSISMETHVAKDALADLSFKSLLLRIIQTQNLVALDQPLLNNRLFDDVIKYINAHLHQEISMDFLSRKAIMNKPAFFKSFKLAFGMTPVNYINRKRLEKAQLLLKTSELNINQVAFEYGYNNVHYFCRIFKNHTGTTPTEWRINRLQ